MAVMVTNAKTACRKKFQEQDGEITRTIRRGNVRRSDDHIHIAVVVSTLDNVCDDRGLFNYLFIFATPLTNIPTISPISPSLSILKI